MDLVEELSPEIADHLKMVLSQLGQVTKCVNQSVGGYEPWQIILITFLSTGFLLYVYKSLVKLNSPNSRKRWFTWARNLPLVRDRINAQLDKVAQDVDKSVHKGDATRQFMQHLPPNGTSGAELVKLASERNNIGSHAYLEGKLSATIFGTEPKELIDSMKEVFDMYAYSNPLHPDVFPGARKMEAEIVRMVLSLYHGDQQSCGVVTSGGTESLLLACLACRNRAYANGIEHPEIVLPTSAHPTFDKAAKYFGLRLVHIVLDEPAMTANVKAMKRAINKNTCMLVGSAPSYPHGAVDPIDEIGQLGVEYNIPVHVDACFGSFVIPFIEQHGAVKLNTRFDFLSPGVTSISCDAHKYGYTPKGTSILMWRNKDLRRHHFFAKTNWSGGIYASPTTAGTKSGLAIALTWCTLMFYGRSGYETAAKSILNNVKYLRGKLAKLPYLKLYGGSEAQIVAFGSDLFDIYQLSEEIGKKGWRLAALQNPPGLHMAVTRFQDQAGVIDQLVQDIHSAAQLLMSKEYVKPKTASIYGMAATLPAELVEEASWIFLDSIYNTAKPKH